MKILFIAPLPPPTTGHSICSVILYNHLVLQNDVKLVNLSKNNFKNGKFEFSRFIQVIKIYFYILKYKNKVDVIYFTISQSILGNIKDLIVYSILHNKLHKAFIHLHGGAIKKNIFNKHKVLFFLNKYFIKKLKGIIVLGESHKKIFQSFVNDNKLIIVKNFYENCYLLSNKSIINKFNQDNSNKIKVLFLSNMQLEKGYMHILEAIKLLESNFLNKFEFHFAGKFDNKHEEQVFLSEVNEKKYIFYHGFVSGEEKINLLYTSHILCLPTSFLEGQPVSIIEAYAAGLVVLAPLTGGIIDIYSNSNGFPIQINSLSISEALKNIIHNNKNLLDIAQYNNKIAINEYQIDKYLNTLQKILIE